MSGVSGGSPPSCGEGDAALPRRREDLAWRVIDGCVVIVDPRSSELHDLSEVATFYWERLDGTRSLEELLSEVVERFDVDREPARRDLEAFLADLTERGLLERGAEG